MKHFALTVAAGTIAMSAAAPAEAVLSGQAISAEYRVPTTATPYPFVTYSPPSFLVGAGQESTIVLEDVTTFNVDFADTSLDLMFDTTLNNPTWNTAPFNGLVFTSAVFATLGGVTVNAMTNFAGFDDSRVSIVGNELRLDWNGLTYDTDTVVGLTFTAGGAVPEPAAWAMMTLGIGLIGAGLRRRAAVRYRASFG